MNKLTREWSVLPPVFRLTTAALLVLGAFSSQGEARNPNTDWFQHAGYGVFVHYLEDLQNAPNQLHSLGRRTTWDACVREFDTSSFAEAMAQAGAGYVIFTMHQRTRFLIAPNATFDRLTGYKPGEACATRDLVEDLYETLHRHHIPLMLYWTGDGPRADPRAAAALGWKNPVPTEYVRKWASVVREYGERYGDKVAGWWVDGCYRFIGYDEEKLGILAAALKAGNDKRIIAFNPGVEDKVQPYSRFEDYTCGEQNQFFDQPAGRWIGGEQWHILSFLGSGQSHIGAAWAMPGVKYSKQELVDYIFAVNQAGGVVSIDVMLYRDGGLDRSQLEALKALRPGLAASRSETPVPPGNLAFRKPARLLSLDASHELEVNGGVHFARLGVDGRPETTALAGGEWPWTYEVDLLQPHAVHRLRLTFARDGYPTQLRLALSADRRTWQTVASADKLEGQPYTCEFAPVTAQYVRVSALKPNGPNQPGTQMAIAELEVYE
ncbi:MAG: discoidin domain-containing protein [Candidatus Omnitrophica bacterium]|nr:discoidin domain-containing protein [Candidatus Omnitrophota bacterium]